MKIFLTCSRIFSPCDLSRIQTVLPPPYFVTDRKTSLHSSWEAAVQTVMIRWQSWVNRIYFGDGVGVGVALGLSLAFWTWTDDGWWWWLLVFPSTAAAITYPSASGVWILLMSRRLPAKLSKTWARHRFASEWNLVAQRHERRKMRWHTQIRGWRSL